MGPGDLAAVVFTSGFAGMSQDFTSSRTRLFAAIDRFVGGRGAIGRGDAQTAYLTLRLVVDALAELQGRRKAVVFFSEGLPWDSFSDARSPSPPPPPPPKWFGLGQSDLPGTIAAAIQSNTSIYAIDPDGLKVDAAACFDQRDPLRRLSWDTGGKVAVNTNSLHEAVARIGTANSHYYLLGYYPTTTKQDGLYRRLRVKVRTPGTEVYSRDGYFTKKIDSKSRKVAPRSSKDEEDVPPALLNAINYPTPISAIRLQATAATFRRDDGKAGVTVVVQVDGRDLAFATTGDTSTGHVNLAVVAVDTIGETAATINKSYAIPLSAASRAVVASTGLRVVEDTVLSPGRYRLHVAAQDAQSQKVGTLRVDVDVPNFRRADFSISDVILTSTRAGEIPGPKSARLETLAKTLPAPPTTARRFAADDTVTLLVEAYDRMRNPGEAVISTAIRAAGGAEVARQSIKRRGEEIKANKGVFRYTQTIPLLKLVPGFYVLTVEARSTTNPEETLRREIPFEVTAGPNPSR